MNIAFNGDGENVLYTKWYPSYVAARQLSAGILEDLCTIKLPATAIWTGISFNWQKSTSQAASGILHLNGIDSHTLCREGGWGERMRNLNSLTFNVIIIKEKRRILCTSSTITTHPFPSYCSTVLMLCLYCNVGG